MCKRDAFRVFVTGDHWRRTAVDILVTDGLIGKLLRDGMSVMVPDRLKEHGTESVCATRMSELDRSWIRCCDAILVLPGRSVARQRDIDHAAEVSVPRFDDIGSLVEYYERTGTYE